MVSTSQFRYIGGDDNTLARSVPAVNTRAITRARAEQTHAQQFSLYPCEQGHHTLDLLLHDVS